VNFRGLKLEVVNPVANSVRIWPHPNVILLLVSLGGLSEGDSDLSICFGHAISRDINESVIAFGRCFVRCAEYYISRHADFSTKVQESTYSVNNTIRYDTVD